MCLIYVGRRDFPQKGWMNKMNSLWTDVLCYRLTHCSTPEIFLLYLFAYSEEVLEAIALVWEPSIYGVINLNSSWGGSRISYTLRSSHESYNFHSIAPRIYGVWHNSKFRVYIRFITMHCITMTSSGPFVGTCPFVMVFGSALTRALRFNW